MDSLTTQRKGINDLPEEVLEIIFDYLTDMSDLKNASLVCVQWSHLAFSGRRMDRVRLNVHYISENPQDHILLLHESKRAYRHIRFDSTTAKIPLSLQIPHLLQVLQIIKGSVVSLHLCECARIFQIRRILLEVLNLKSLSLEAVEWFGFSYNEEEVNFLQLPVFNELTELSIGITTSMPLAAFDICTIAPNLQKISMDCVAERALKVYRHFSHQLKLVKVNFGTYYSGLAEFCQIMFPELVEIELVSDSKKAIPFIMDWIFITGSKRLQHASLRCKTTSRVVNMLVDNCRDINFLRIETNELANVYTGLAKLKMLKTLYLVLDGNPECKVFEECKPIPSLKKLEVSGAWIGNQLDFYKGLPTVMPNLSELILNVPSFDDSCLQFICNNIASLKSLALEDCFLVTDKGFEYLGRLPHLFRLSLKNFGNQVGLFQRISSTSVNSLSLYNCERLTDEDLLLIPQVFPSLQVLKMDSCAPITIACIRFQLPWCAMLVNKMRTNDELIKILPKTNQSV